MRFGVLRVEMCSGTGGAICCFASAFPQPKTCSSLFCCWLELQIQLSKYPPVNTQIAFSPPKITNFYYRTHHALHRFVITRFRVRRSQNQRIFVQVRSKRLRITSRNAIPRKYNPFSFTLRTWIRWWHFTIDNMVIVSIRPIGVLPMKYNRSGNRPIFHWFRGDTAREISTTTVTFALLSRLIFVMTVFDLVWAVFGAIFDTKTQNTGKKLLLPKKTIVYLAV